jgi:hypothetical protein
VGAARWVALAFLLVFFGFFLWSELRSVPASMTRLDKVTNSADSFTVSGDVVVPLTVPLVDPETLVSFPPSVVRAQRVVEYCQWQERRESNNQFSYTIRWLSRPVNSVYFHSHTGEFRNPKPIEVPETVFDANVRLQTSGLSTNSSNLLPALTGTSFKFRMEDYAQLKQSRAFQGGFIFMDADYILLDYSRISNEHEFYKNMHRLTEFVTRGFVWDSAGPSLCTPGDIRTHYVVWEAPKEPVSMLAARNGDFIVPLKVKNSEDAFFVRKGDFDRRELLELEAADIIWWRNLWRVLFVLSLLAAGLVEYRDASSRRSKTN